MAPDGFDSLLVITNDGKEFTIQPIMARTPDGPQPAARLWHNGIVVHAVTADSHQAAMDQAFRLIRDIKKSL